MFNIADYLKRTVGIIDTNLLYRRDISEIIKKHTTIEKEGQFFEVKDGVLRTTLSPAEKMMLFIKREPLLLDLAPFFVKDIR